ncbi:histidine phosphotransferase family protein [Pseudogemmobacter humi]|uniref:Histidine phosphotransferase ChpT C-terminal domain-containing protein n=1 Tax=Pseudogemmobacter humi TaxID=2483812 RepID=A0A3P5XF92_9RHOB|nr:histidine phosphotransferase family protein [Pseudogemmobacter humi]VDC30062.1 hypothetical protein XINFAN_02422 [Pseudogemmobacter humi]
MQNKPDLAALIGSRICHDLISPIGAIGNGVELMMMDRASASPELALIAESVSSANARIRFFRVAYGMAGADQRIARGEVTGILAGITHGGRLRIEWISGTDLDRREVKLAFLLLQCLESAMAYGGQIRVEETASGWEILGEATRLRVEAPLWDMLAGQEARDPVLAAQVQFALVAAELRQHQRRLVTEIGETGIRLSW